MIKRWSSSNPMVTFTALELCFQFAIFIVLLDKQ
jgi:hypothetical protein